MQTQSPPFEKLGVFAVDRFFPDKDRFELAMLLNNILAAPAFQTWLEGEPLDVARLLYHAGRAGRATPSFTSPISATASACSSSPCSTRRSKRGCAAQTRHHQPARPGLLRRDLRLPAARSAIRRPKTPMLRMLKQARAFGVGLVLATQNPVDIDYKALSNAGTWFIGKLGTDQDKQRLLDGLSSAAGAGLDRAEYDRPDLGPGQARLPAAQRPRKSAGAVPDALGDELPGRTGDPQPDSRA